LWQNENISIKRATLLEEEPFDNEVFHSNPGAANRHNKHAIYQAPFVQGFLRMSK
jgi:hypothetical protein